jgi:hypothetical protein
MDVVRSGLLNSVSEESSDTKRTHPVAFLITFPVFMGYACCFSLQKRLSTVIGLTDGVSGNAQAKVFGIAVTFVYFFNLLFRVFGHNIVFGCLAPRYRILCALGSCCIAMTVLAVIGSRPVPPFQSVVWVFIAYAFMGTCEGTFGPNMLNIVNHLGDTRGWVVLAMPCGVATITIGGFALMAAGMPYYALYLATAALSLSSVCLYLCTIFRATSAVDPATTEFDLRQFLADLREIRQWFPKIWSHCLVFIVDMLCLSMFNPGCTLYAYSTRVTCRLFGFTLGNDMFMLAYNIGSFSGDFLSRRVMAKRTIVSPIWFLLLLGFAFALVMSLIPEIAPLAAFGFSWANGGLYAQTTRLIGEEFTEGYHLTATSTWLFLGDVGSTTGSMIIQVVRPYIAGLKAIMY